MSKLKTDDMYTKDKIVMLVEQNGGNTNVTYKSTGVGKTGDWTITIEWDDTLDGLTFLKALRHYDGLRYEVA